MNTRIDQSRTNPRGSHQKFSHIEEEFEMRTATHTAQLNDRRPGILNMKTPGKLLGAIALGALMMAATALPFGPVHADETARPMSREAVVSYNSQVDGLLQWEGISRDQRSPAKVTSPSTFTYGEKLDQLVNIESTAKVTRLARFTYGEMLDQLVNIEGAAKVARLATITYGEKLEQLRDMEGTDMVTRTAAFTYGEKLDRLVDIEGEAKETRLASFTHQEKLGQIRDWEGTI